MVLAFMVGGLKSKWKQAGSCFFIDAAIESEVLLPMVAFVDTIMYVFEKNVCMLCTVSYDSTVDLKNLVLGGTGLPKAGSEYFATAQLVVGLYRTQNFSSRAQAKAKSVQD